MAQKKLLRVLYTVNGSPQYILARSYSQVQVNLIPPTGASHPDMGSSSGVQELHCLYASVSLKTCLDTICRSSPELTHDTTRDFSLYVLDPLESSSAPAPVQINNSNKDKCQSKNAASASEPRGVAVGLGLMSWALATDDNDSAPVVGTLVKQPNGQDALEVIFALRETTAMKRPAWSLPPPSSSQPSSSQSRASSRLPEPPSSQPEVKPFLAEQLASERSDQITRETLASIQLRNKAKVKPPKPPPKPARPSTVPTTESDKLLNADVNIGPTKKKGRRPKAAASVNNGSVGGNAIAGPSGSGSGSWPQDAIVIDGSDSESTQAQATSTTSQKTARSSSGTTKSTANSFAPAPIAPIVPPPPAPSIPTTVPATTPTQVKTEPQEVSLLDVLAYLSAASASEHNPQNAAILAALGTIDAKAPEAQPQAGPPQTPAPANQDAPANPALVSALKQLLTMYLQPQTPPIPPTPQANHSRPAQPPPLQPRTDSQQTSSAPTNSEPVTVDKENVNPTPKKLAADKNNNMKPPPSSPARPSSVTASTSRRSSNSDRPLQSVTFGARTNDASSSSRAPPTTSTASSSGQNENLSRKRTLSDFMDEKESQKSKSKGKERERSDRRDKSSSSSRPKTNPVDSMRHYPMILASATPRSEQPSNYYRTALESTSDAPMTSPSKPQPRTDFLAQPPPSFVPPLPSSFMKSHSTNRMLASPSRRISASSPARKEPRRKYVVPEWAKTNTMTQPRLSDMAKKAIEEAEQAKKLERLAARRVSSNMNRSNKSKAVSAPQSQANSSGEENSQPVASTSTAGPIAAARGPIVSSDRPLFAATDITFPFLRTRSSSPEPRAVTIPKTPKTPVRTRTAATPGDDDPLFTPMGRSGGSLFGSVVGSARSYTQHTPSVLTSPLGNRKKAKVSPSPARSLLTGLSFPSSSTWSKTSSSVQSSEDSKTVHGSDVGKPLEHHHEEPEELDAPPSSLPIASSDIDIDEHYTQDQADNGDNIPTPNDDSETDTVPVKQHWPGLPPSSPILMPESTDDDEEMEEIPIATSDSETDAEMTPVDSPAYFDEDLAAHAGSLSAADLSAFFPDLLGPNTDGPSPPSDLDAAHLFHQFTHMSSDVDADVFAAMLGSSQASDQTQIDMDGGVEGMFDQGLEGIDFTEFWESFKPLLDNSTQVGVGEVSGEEGSGSLATDVEPGNGVNHVKLADDIQGLLSGCLM